MRWWFVCIKSMKEQVRDYWILITIVVMAPLFIAIYYLMEESGDPVYHVALVNLDKGVQHQGRMIHLGDSLVRYGEKISGSGENTMLRIRRANTREIAKGLLQKGAVDVGIVLPHDLSQRVLDPGMQTAEPACFELMGDVTRMEYIIGAVWAEELITSYVLLHSQVRLPVTWTETTLGYSGKRTMFEYYVPGLLILSIIMIIFSAAASIVREPETRTLERLKVSRLTAMEFLGGIALVQLLIAVVSLILALLTAISLGYSLIPGTLGFIFLVCFLTALSMISFSLIVAAMCRSVKEVAIIGTFPLFLLMFFTGAAFPLEGGKLFTLGGVEVMLNDVLSPKYSVNALHKVLTRGLEVRETLPELMALMVLTVIYFFLGTWAFRRRHMRAG